MLRFFDWKGDYRFVGATRGLREIHIARFQAEVQGWFNRNGTGSIHTLCGKTFDPAFFSTMMLPPDRLCEECNRVHRSENKPS